MNIVDHRTIKTPTNIILPDVTVRDEHRFDGPRDFGLPDWMIEQIIANGNMNKIPSIKLMRRIYPSMGLHEAKTIVEYYFRVAY